MSFTDTYETNILTWAFTATAVTRPTSWTMALYTAAPTDTGGGTEISTSGTGYARQSVSFTVTGDTGSNTSVVEFPAATASWGTIVAAGIFDNSGNLVTYASLTTSRTIATGDIFRIPAGEFDVTLN